MTEIPVEEHAFLRAAKSFPHVWCAGCGIGIAMGAIIRAVGDLKLDRNQVSMISGIGCSGRMSVYVDFDTLHTTHGRALAFATGLKLARPEMTVLTVMGDGDALAIGGNHFIHAARRNIDMTAIVINNNVYGMTGGQVSPTTPLGARTTTSPYGQIEPAFDIAGIAIAAGAAFVARTTTYHTWDLERLLVRAIQKKGFSVVEVVTHCHVQYGRLTKLPSPIQLLRWQRDNTITVAAAARGGAEGKIIRGVLADRDLPEYVEQYQKVIARAQGKEA